jgi:predicted dehydrogenase
MKQIFQDLKNGEILQKELPLPSVKPGHLIIETSKSLVSLGTEKMLLDFGKAGWINKARQQPEKVKQVLQKIKTDGVGPTVKAVTNKLNQPMPIGYSNVGTVLDLAMDVKGFKKGDRVVSNGYHAEVVCVPYNLCACIPDNVDNVTAAFTVVSAIALQGIRLIKPTLGESIAVIGLGLIGQLTCQILRANGCRVIGFDYNETKVRLATKHGVEAWNLSNDVDSVKAAYAFSGSNGVDGVVITASTKSNLPIEQAPEMCRKRGRVVLVGVVGLKLNRSSFYNKEISFQVSCSYGPGRYDMGYEQKGFDYPIGYVRWTEQRNFQAVLQLMSEGKIVVEELVSEMVDFKKSTEVYQKANEDTLGIIFDYSGLNELVTQKIILKEDSKKYSSRTVKVGIIGSGDFTSGILLPVLKKTNAELVGIASRSGMNSSYLGNKFKFSFHTSEYKDLLNHPEINAIIITTRHDTHSKLVIEALKAGKHVFVEKPIALNQDELLSISDVYNEHQGQQLMVGFNRRFSPHAVKMKKLVSKRQSPLSMVFVINAGMIPADHWIQDSEIGGGRIVGEACHFIDLLTYLVGSPIKSVNAVQLGDSHDGVYEDKMSIQLVFSEGSIGTIHYFANGNKALEKERLEIFFDGKVLQLSNFKKLKGYGFSKFNKHHILNQDKGYVNEISQFVAAVHENAKPLIPFQELKNVTLASFAAVESAKKSKVIEL